MKKSTILLLIILLLTNIVSYGQKRKVADEYFANSMYKEAVQLYEQLYVREQDNKKKADVAFHIGECYRYMNRTDKAIAWYDTSYYRGYDKPELHLHYGESLLREGHYPEAEPYLQKYIALNPDDKYAQERLLSEIYALERPVPNPYIKVKPLNALNTAGYEYGIGEFQNHLTYAYGKAGNESGTREISSRTSVGYSELLLVQGNAKDSLRVYSMKGLHKKKCSECCLAYDSVMDVAYITRTTPEKKIQTQIVAFEYNASKGQWETPAKSKQSKLFSLPDAVTGHAFITEDGQRMYFSGILPDGYGGADIWYVDRQADNSWGKPVNAGPGVNTTGDEIFPTSYDNILYFSSTGHIGFGGFDIYASKIAGNTFEKAMNVGQPINSHRDDMDLQKSSTMPGFLFVSDRKAETYDDIYMVVNDKIFNLEIRGKVLDRETNEYIPGATVWVDVTGEEPYSLTTGDNGEYLISSIVPGRETNLTAEKWGYVPDSKNTPVFPEPFGSFDMTAPSADPNAVLYLSRRNPVGIIRDAATHKPLANATIIVKEDGIEMAPLQTNGQGEYTLTDVTPTDKIFTVSHNDYNDTTFAIAANTIKMNKNGYAPVLDLYLTTKVTPEQAAILAGLEHVYYGFDRANICPESMADLDKIIDYLRTHPETRIEIESHTDSRGSDAYNKILSTRRAQFVVNYIKENDISADRITWKAYGKSRLYIPAAVTKAEHWLNRRSEFIVKDPSGKELFRSNPLKKEDFGNFCGGSKTHVRIVD